MSWRDYLDEVIPLGYQRNAFEKAIAHIVYGDAKTNWLVVLSGPAKSGKSTLIQYIKAFMNVEARWDESARIGDNLFWSTKGKRCHPHSLAASRDARLVTLDDFSMKLDLHKVMSVLRGELMIARRMRGHPFSFRPQFSFLIGTKDVSKIGLGCDFGRYDNVVVANTRSIDGESAFSVLDVAAELRARL